MDSGHVAAADAILLLAYPAESNHLPTIGHATLRVRNNTWAVEKEEAISRVYRRERQVKSLGNSIRVKKIFSKTHGSSSAVREEAPESSVQLQLKRPKESLAQSRSR